MYAREWDSQQTARRAAQQHSQGGVTQHEGALETAAHLVRSGPGEHMLALQGRFGNRHVQRVVNAAWPGQAVQRQVMQRFVSDFDATTERYDPPGTDILETIDMSYFVEKPKQVASKVRGSLNDPLVKSLEVPTQVTAVLEFDEDDSPPQRQGSRSRNIGLIGRDEFWLKAGQPTEAFEGGHLVPHALWHFEDPDVAEAGSYRNLVPMSRTMNVMDWADREDRIKDKLKEIPAGDQLEVTIDIEHQPYKLQYGWLARLFDLHLQPAVNPQEKITLYGWLPVRGVPSWRHIETGSEDEMSGVEENTLRDTHTKIKTPQELIQELQQTGFWHRMSKTLKSQLESL